MYAACIELKDTDGKKKKKKRKIEEAEITLVDCEPSLCLVPLFSMSGVSFRISGCK